MKSLLIRRLLAASVLTIASAGSAASADPAPRPGTYEGPATELGKGTARTFVVIGEDGAPTQLGVGLSDTVMDGIEHSPNLMLTLPLPAEAKATGFDHVLLDSFGDLARHYGAPGLPATLFIGADGVLRHAHLGEISRETLQSRISGLLSQDN